MSLTKIDYLRYLYYVYFLKRGTITKSWHSPAIFDLSGLDSKSINGAYPIDFSKDDTPELLTDSNGIPMIDYASLGQQYNPWFAGHIALGRYTKWLRTKDDNLLFSFKKIADWFVETAVPSVNELTWLYNFDWFDNRIKPWKSGLSQAHANSTLLRAATVFKNETYARTAVLAIEDMLAPMSKGGALHRWDDGTISIEESVKFPPTAILNGHLFAVISIWEAARFFNSDHYLNIAQLGWKFVENKIERYDLGYWSCYSLKTIARRIPDIASVHYHDVHVALLKVSAAITKNQFFNEVADRFDSYQRTPTFRRKAIWMKRFAKLMR